MVISEEHGREKSNPAQKDKSYLSGYKYDEISREGEWASRNHIVAGPECDNEYVMFSWCLLSAAPRG